jgi:pyruvate kinase
VRRAEEIANQKVGFLLDTKGPEIRTELFEGDAKEYTNTKLVINYVLQQNKV